MKSKTIMAVAEALGLKYLEDIGEAAGVFNGYFISSVTPESFTKVPFPFHRWGSIRAKTF